MKIRDRVRELRRVQASQLRPNPLNWRTHSAAQSDALRGVLAEVGWAGALLARELPDGNLELIDGHLRAEACPDMEVPVLVLDVNEEESRQLLATVDPLAAMAGADGQKLQSLIDSVAIENLAVRELVDHLLDETLSAPAGGGAEEGLSRADRAEVPIPESYQVVVNCEDESAQRTLFERLVQEGYRCRVLTL